MDSLLDLLVTAAPSADTPGTSMPRQGRRIGSPAWHCDPLT